MTAVITLYMTNHPVKEIAEHTGVIHVCQKLVKWFEEEGEEGISAAPRHRFGKPKLASPTTLKLIGKQAKANTHLTVPEIKESNSKVAEQVILVLCAAVTQCWS